VVEGKDILLIKLDPFGNFKWNKFVGGSGDEEVSSIVKPRIMACWFAGTNTINGLSTIFIMKTDKDGTLTN